MPRRVRATASGHDMNNGRHPSRALVDGMRESLPIVPRYGKTNSGVRAVVAINRGVIWLGRMVGR